MRARLAALAVATAALVLAPATAAHAAGIPDSGWKLSGSADCTPNLMRVLFVSTRCG